LSFRTRIAVLTASAVAIAVLFVSLGGWVLVRRELRAQVDETLFTRGRAGARNDSLRRPRPPGGGVSIFDFNLETAQVITASGDIELTSVENLVLPVSDRDRAVAAGIERPYLHDERVNGVHVRVLTAPLPGDRAVLVARDLSEVDATLRGFTFIVILLAGLGVASGALAGLVVARRAVTPVERLTGAAEHVARTKDLSAAIEVEGTDELGRLGHSFNEMLSALSQSREQQSRLVADASHELRTPLTSLRTNVEVLSRQPKMPAAERAQVLSDLQSELEELSLLVSEIVSLATEQKADDEAITDVALDELVSAAADRARRRSGRTIAVTSQASIVQGRPLALERAVTNLLDNATKWGPPDEAIDVSVSGGRVEVRDRGPGIAEADRPLVFDRFYRATAARALPGSGLGLSIVKQVVEAHGGRVWAAEPPDGGPGAVVGFDLSPDS
jgi:two-component system sensor histidine kinase MprB